MKRTARTISREPTEQMIEAAYPLIEGMATNTPSRMREATREIFRTMWDLAPVVTTDGLTRRQREIHEIIAAFVAEHGFSPTYVEISAACKPRPLPVDQVHKALTGLRRKGIVAWTPYHTRSLRLLCQPGHKPPPFTGS